MPNSEAMERALIRIRDGICGYCNRTALEKITPWECDLRNDAGRGPCRWDPADAEAEATAALNTPT